MPVKSEYIPPPANPAHRGTVMSQRSRTVSTGEPEHEAAFVRSGAPSLATGAASRRPRSEVVQSSGSRGGDFDDVLLLEVRNNSSKFESRPNGVDSLAAAVADTATVNRSFVSHGFTFIGDKVKQLNDTLGELQSLGIQHVANLPELVLVGDQSAGKSSLMSSFSGIYLPRSEGACTRCPVHIRLSGSQGRSWSCKISLQQDYQYCPPANVTRANPFGPWFEQRREIKEFAVVDNPADIEATLRWAQIATLNPSKSHTVFQPNQGDVWRRVGPRGLDDIHNEAAFSPNTVALDIMSPSPGLPDLSFYDLPGVFTSAKRDEDQYLVKVVENLTAKYISHQQAIILWAVPMNADPETSSTFSIIRAQKAQNRTIGIMTKADLLPPGPHAAAQWLAMLRGEQHCVGHGYFITARPVVSAGLLPDATLSQPDRDRDPGREADCPINDLSRQEAYEEAFFNKQHPGQGNQEWRADFRDFADRCTVNSLIAFMSQQLSAEFAKSLPQIKEKVAIKLHEVRMELEQIPGIPASPELEVRRCLAEFGIQVRSTLDSSALAPSWTEIVQTFRQGILQLKPKYIVKMDHMSGGSGGRITNSNNAIDLTQDTNGTPPPGSYQHQHVRSSVMPTPRRRGLDEYLDGRRDLYGPMTPAKRTRTINGVAIKSEGSSGEGGGGGWDGSPAMTVATLHPSRQLDGGVGAQAKARWLHEVRQIIISKCKPGMPGIVTEDVYSFLCMEAVRPWNGPLQLLVHQTHQLLDVALHDILNVSFSSLKQRYVFQLSSALLKSYVSERMKALHESLLHQYRLESRKFFTLDKEHLMHHEQAEAKILTRHRHYYRMLTHLGDRAGGNGAGNGSNGNNGAGNAAAAAAAAAGGAAVDNHHRSNNSVVGNRPAPQDWDSMAQEDRVREEARMIQEMAKLGPDPYKKELDVCAYVRGYFLTASARFIDTCSMHIMCGLIPDVVDDMSKMYLDKKLRVSDGSKDPAIGEKRKGLQEDLSRFEQTIGSIERLETRVRLPEERDDAT